MQLVDEVPPTEIELITSFISESGGSMGDSDDSDSIGQTLLGATKAILCLSSYTIRPYFYMLEAKKKCLFVSNISTSSPIEYINSVAFIYFLIQFYIADSTATIHHVMLDSLA
ncbi:tRNA (guanine-N(7)-)-methyltransferase non-catalytic subunit [Dirofilaria immitis]